jgi:hypothetical protein
MRQILFVGLSAVSLLAVALSISPAAASRYCLQGRNWGYPGNCQFSTLHQCRASASGTGASCGINPRHASARQRQAH